MIREMQKDDIKRIVDIWLSASILAHDFIEYTFWHNKVGKILQELSRSKVYVYINDTALLVGFIVLQERSKQEGYIEELFIDPRFQRKGFGSKLLKYIKDIYQSLSLHVYKSNEDTIMFYKVHNFTKYKEHIEKETGQLKIQMVWTEHSSSAASIVAPCPQS